MSYKLSKFHTLSLNIACKEILLQISFIGQRCYSHLHYFIRFSLKALVALLGRQIVKTSLQVGYIICFLICISPGLLTSCFFLSVLLYIGNIIYFTYMLYFQIQLESFLFSHLLIINYSDFLECISKFLNCFLNYKVYLLLNKFLAGNLIGIVCYCVFEIPEVFPFLYINFFPSEVLLRIFF